MRAWVLLLTACTAGPAPVRIGSKAFTESVILGEIAVQLARSAGARAEHVRQLGGSQVVFKALLAAEIAAYPEYTGTLREEILAGEKVETDQALREALARRGVVLGGPLGFENTYIIGMKETVAAELGVRTISDLRKHPELRAGFSSEFMDRGDGWPALRDRYGLAFADARGMAHDLAYRALDSGAIHLTDLYSTDPEIQKYALRALEDDLHHFPEYQAVLLRRADLTPEVAAALAALEGQLPVRTMIDLNARARLDRVPEDQVAAGFLASALGVRSVAPRESRAARLGRHTLEHLWLVAVSLCAAIVLALPLGVAAARRPRLGQAILGAAGVVQTIPSLALLVFMIPLLGIGAPPAVAALFLYSLLPIVRNTHAGLSGIAPPLRESAEALGLPPRARLWRVELPMAAPSILAGVKTSAVINVGTATLGALIGAGGYGQPILTGIRLDDTALILEGAVPAAVLALAVQWLFDGVERVVVPRGLRL